MSIETKGRSNLQKLHSAKNWAIFFFLKKFSLHLLHRFPIVTNQTLDAIDDYNIAVHKLEKAIAKDYELSKMHILRERKKLLDE